METCCRSKCGDAGWRVAQALDLAAITTTVGASSFAHFAKGGYHERLQLRSYANRLRNEIFVQPSFTRTGPASSKR
jgi:hypothetical protein